MTEKQMLPKIRYSKHTGKSYMKYTMSVMRKMGAKEKRKNFEDKNYITDYELRSQLTQEFRNSPQQKIYRYFHVNLHSLLGRAKLKHDRRSKLGYGDLIRFCVSTTCYCDSQKNVFTVLHSPRLNAEVLLHKMYLRNTECAEMSRPMFNPRLQQIALENMKKTEGGNDDDEEENDEDDDFNELFASTETLSFQPKHALTSADEMGPDAKKRRLSINNEPFQHKSV